ncbi:MAG: fluoride efflux transporter CrcB [Aestuariivita sp.]|nr:fluoride efflux transporter CrcB [Aestuariivita sp.]
MFSTVIQVAIGGAIGAVLRYTAGLGLIRFIGHTEIPLGVLFVNIVGSCLLGIFAATATQRDFAVFSPFVVTGLLGGFTTFSAFSLETFTLIEKGQLVLAVLYVFLSVVGSISGLMTGFWLMRISLT